MTSSISAFKIETGSIEVINNLSNPLLLMIQQALGMINIMHILDLETVLRF